MKILMLVQIFGHQYNLLCFVECNSVCKQVSRCLFADRDQHWLLDYCLTVYNGSSLEYLSPYTQLLWIKFSSQLMSKFVSLIHPLMMAFNIIVKDPVHITSKDPVQKSYSQFYVSNDSRTI